MRHERCPDDVSGDMQEDEIPGGALSLNLLTTQTMATMGIFPCKENSIILCRIVLSSLTLCNTSSFLT